MDSTFRAIILLLISLLVFQISSNDDERRISADCPLPVLCEQLHGWFHYISADQDGNEEGKYIGSKVFMPSSIAKGAALKCLAPLPSQRKDDSHGVVHLDRLNQYGEVDCLTQGETISSLNLYSVHCGSNQTITRTGTGAGSCIQATVQQVDIGYYYLNSSDLLTGTSTHLQFQGHERLSYYIPSHIFNETVGTTAAATATDTATDTTIHTDTWHAGAGLLDHFLSVKDPRFGSLVFNRRLQVHLEPLSSTATAGGRDREEEIYSQILHEIRFSAVGVTALKLGADTSIIESSVHDIEPGSWFFTVTGHGERLVPSIVSNDSHSSDIDRGSSSSSSSSSAGGAKPPMTSIPARGYPSFGYIEFVLPASDIVHNQRVFVNRTVTRKQSNQPTAKTNTNTETTISTATGNGRGEPAGDGTSKASSTSKLLNICMWGSDKMDGQRQIWLAQTQRLDPDRFRVHWILGERDVDKPFNESVHYALTRMKLNNDYGDKLDGDGDGDVSVGQRIIDACSASSRAHQEDNRGQSGMSPDETVVHTLTNTKYARRINNNNNNNNNNRNALGEVFSHPPLQITVEELFESPDPTNTTTTTDDAPEGSTSTEDVDYMELPLSASWPQHTTGKGGGGDSSNAVLRYAHARLQRADYVIDEVTPPWCRRFYSIMRRMLQTTAQCDVLVYGNARNFNNDVLITDTAHAIGLPVVAELQNLFMHEEIVPSAIVGPSTYAVNHESLQAARRVILPRRRKPRDTETAGTLPPDQRQHQRQHQHQNQRAQTVVIPPAVDVDLFNPFQFQQYVPPVDSNITKLGDAAEDPSPISSSSSSSSSNRAAFSSESGLPSPPYHHPACPRVTSRHTSNNNTARNDDNDDNNNPCIIIGFIARLAPEKSPGLFLQAMYELYHLHPFARFTVVGDGVLRSALEDLAAVRLAAQGQGGDLPAPVGAGISTRTGADTGTGTGSRGRRSSSGSGSGGSGRSSSGGGSGGSGRSSSSDSGGRKDESRGGWPTDAVHFTGWVQEKQLPSYLAGIDIVVNPTLRAWSETFCITNTQVMSMGIPLVTFAVGGIGEYVSAPAPPPPSAAAPPPPPAAAAAAGAGRDSDAYKQEAEINVDGHHASSSTGGDTNSIPDYSLASNAVVVNRATPMAIARAVHYLITHPTERTAIGFEGRQTVVEYFHLDRQMEQYAELYSSLVQGGRPEGAVRIDD